MLEDAGHRTESILTHVYGEADYSKVVTGGVVNETEYEKLSQWAKFRALDAELPGHSGLVKKDRESLISYDMGDSNASFQFMARSANSLVKTMICSRILFEALCTPLYIVYVLQV